MITTCPSPKSTSISWMAGCGTSDADKILDCHKYWIGDEGMQWKRFVQHNPLGPGEAYSWAYDEAVCSIGDNEMGDSKPWCKDGSGSKAAVDYDGNVTDHSCPCTVGNPISVFNVVPFGNVGWGKHMHIHVFDIMYPGYVPPTTFNDFKSIDLQIDESEREQFHVKVVN